ncbi:putative lipid II flippase FtsW [Candidatus Dependentiae bacterium]|nr:putative lipid II flippase FtsW [Candidatus Dependentiae bacterium]
MALPISRLRADVQTLMGIVTLLTLVGLVFVYSSSSILALEKCGSDLFFLKKQAAYTLLAVIGFLVFALVPYEKLKHYAPMLFVASLGLMGLTFVPGLGIKMHGANRWLHLGFISLQPSELLKIFLILYMGYFLEKKQYRIKSFLYTYLPFLLVLGVSFALLLKQPDFGSVITLFSTALVLFFVAECNMRYLLTTALLACPAIVYLIFSKSYRLSRILIFLNPWADPQGKGFQIIQSLIAIGNGKMWGVGIANSKQKFFYLPMQHTDFIFPIIAEEIGFIGSLGLIVLYAALLFFGMRIVLLFRERFGFFSSLGFIVLLTIQALINLMVSCGLLPTKGLGLPFISYGGTALIASWCMIGFIANCARHERINADRN